MAYQPALAEHPNGFVVSAYEALVRVHHSQIGINTFSLIQAAETDGTMPELDLAIIKMACADATDAPDVPLWMNLSQITLSRPDVISSIADALCIAQCPTKFTIECSGLMIQDTHLGENVRHIEVSNDQTTSSFFS